MKDIFNVNIAINRMSIRVISPGTSQSKNLRCFDANFVKKSFIHRHELENHLALHQKTNKHECKLCNKSFNLKGNLTAHIKKIHNKITNFKCEHCSKTFFRH